MKVYYWKGKPNFGDLLTPLLIQKFSHINTEWSEAADSDLVMVGSILEHLPENYEGIIAGCGKLHENFIRNYPKAKILAVRGPRTAKALNLKGNFIMADPGLIADELVGYQDKKYNLGIVPHWTDTTLEHNKLFLQFNPKIIRVSDDPLEVIRQIGQCKKIVSSSLHGIIIADAFGIERRIEISPKVLENPKQEGGLFKWHDYCESIGMKLKIGQTQLADENIIVEKQHELYDLFQQIEDLHS
jgi:pyruvyltransferase